jgi:hypothetical protein
MVQPDYDFFATNRPASLDPAVLPGGPKPPVVNRFGSTETPAPPAALATPDAEPSLFGPPPVAPAQFPVAPASGYQPGRVNQFGTPVDVAAAPVGPYAAPGVAAAAIESPGLVSTWDPAARAGGRAAARQAHVGSEARPGTVLAAGILAIINGALTLLGVVAAWLALAALSSAIQDSGVTVSASTTAWVNAILFVLLVVGAAWVVMGIGVVRGSRTWVKVLRVLVFVGTVIAILMVAGNQSLDRILTLLLDLVMICLLWNKQARDWLDAA